MIRSPSPVPAWLEAAPITQPLPPVQANRQELPFDQIGWRDFERLCLRLARLTADVEDCRHYGVQGDD